MLQSDKISSSLKNSFRNAFVFQDHLYPIHSILIKYINLYLKASYNIYLLWGCLYSLGIFSPSKTALCQQSFVRLIPYVLCYLYLC